MGRHLNESAWFDRQPATGTLRMKRVSAANETKFPRKYRLIYQREGAVKLVKAVMVDNKCSLAEAWGIVKGMFN
jgi:hypothetical protein